MNNSIFEKNYAYPDSCFKLISDTEANQMKTAYLGYVTENLLNIRTLFLNTEGYIGGYEISLQDYIYIMSFPGVQQWVVNYGYSPGKNLQLILAGTTINGVKMTPNILLTNPFNLPPPVYPDRVPKSLYDSWLQAYRNLLNEELVRATFLQSPFDSGNTLKGYTFKFYDFLDELYSNGVSMPETTPIKFNIVNHALAISNGELQTSYPGMIGLAICADVLEASSEIRYYDISAPCPPTCP